MSPTLIERFYQLFGREPKRKYKQGDIVVYVDNEYVEHEVIFHSYKHERRYWFGRDPYVTAHYNRMENYEWFDCYVHQSVIKKLDSSIMLYPMKSEYLKFGLKRKVLVEQLTDFQCAIQRLAIKAQKKPDY